MLVKVKVWPGSKKENIVRKSADRFEMKLREPAQKGLANKKVFEILANCFKIPLKDIKLVKGAKQRNRIFGICLNSN